MRKKLGTVISGALSEGFSVRLDRQVQLERIKTGHFVVLTGTNYRFFSLVTDLKLEVANPEIMLTPPGEHETLLHKVLSQRDIFAIAHIKPVIMLDQANKISPVKTIPPHFAVVYEANAQDVALIFGEERQNKKYFKIGQPLDMDAAVCLDLEKLVERSNGIFGKTGTGKTFITRLILAGLIKNQKAVNLIFDMHSEYGLQSRTEAQGHGFVKGLKTLFPDKVVIFSLDPASTRRRGGAPDVCVTISYQDIKVSDILSLQDELNLHSTALEAAYLIYAKYKENWLQKLLQVGGDQPKELAQEVGAHPESVAALYRKLRRIEQLPFFVDGSAPRAQVVEQLLEYLNRGTSVIIEFGNFTSTFVYLLIANIVTGRIHDAYVRKTEKFLGSQSKSDEPQKLLITIEEAHKFLNPTAAKQTIFGIIAREMRKYYVSLLVVDQRPSGIDPEIISQIGTKIIAQMSDDQDIQAVLTGVSNAQGLKTILATLDTKKQVLVLGHAITMPVVIETREYGELFYRDMQADLLPIEATIEELYR
jgi:hypothetical protein